MVFQELICKAWIFFFALSFKFVFWILINLSQELSSLCEVYGAVVSAAIINMLERPIPELRSTPNDPQTLGMLICFNKPFP